MIIFFTCIEFQVYLFSAID